MGQFNNYCSFEETWQFLRLCLDPKDLKKDIKSNRWYNRKTDDVLQELANSKYFSLVHLLGHIPLDKESSLLMTFNTQ